MRLGLLSLVATVVAAVPGEHVAGPASASGEPLLVAPAPGCFSGETGVEPLNGPSLSTYCPVTGTASPDNHKCLLSLPGELARERTRGACLLPARHANPVQSPLHHTYICNRVGTLARTATVTFWSGAVCNGESVENPST